MQRAQTKHVSDGKIPGLYRPPGKGLLLLTATEQPLGSDNKGGKHGVSCPSSRGNLRFSIPFGMNR